MFDEMISPLFLTNWGRRAGAGALIALALMLIIQLIYVPLNWYADWKLAHSKAASLTSGASFAAVSIKPQVDFSKLHLFGHALATSSERLPITSLQLSLVGVVQAGLDAQSTAIISTEGQPGKIYKVNDHLPSGARIAYIGAESITLENAGHMEKLPLQRTSLSFQERPKILWAKK